MLDPNGEPIGEMGVGSVVPISKWADTTLFQFACDRAEQSFERAGALAPIEFDGADIQVQEFPAQDTIVFLFHKKVAGASRYHPCVIKFAPEMVSELVTMGRWVRAS